MGVQPFKHRNLGIQGVLERAIENVIWVSVVVRCEVARYLHERCVYTIETLSLSDGFFIEMQRRRVKKENYRKTIPPSYFGSARAWEKCVGPNISLSISLITDVLARCRIIRPKARTFRL